MHLQAFVWQALLHPHLVKPKPAPVFCALAAVLRALFRWCWHLIAANAWLWGFQIGFWRSVSSNIRPLLPVRTFLQKLTQQRPEHWGIHICLCPHLPGRLSHYPQQGLVHISLPTLSSYLLPVLSVFFSLPAFPDRFRVLAEDAQAVPRILSLLSTIKAEGDFVIIFPIFNNFFIFYFQPLGW